MLSPALTLSSSTPSPRFGALRIHVVDPQGTIIRDEQSGGDASWMRLAMARFLERTGENPVDILDRHGIDVLMSYTRTTAVVSVDFFDRVERTLFPKEAIWATFETEQGWPAFMARLFAKAMNVLDQKVKTRGPEAQPTGEYLVARAQQFEESGELRAAVADYQTALGEHLKSPDGRAFRAETCYQLAKLQIHLREQGDRAVSREAIAAVLSEALMLNPGDAELQQKIEQLIAGTGIIVSSERS